MGRTTKKKPCDYIAMARSRGFGWIGKYPGRASRNTTWKCKKCNYLWETTYSMLQQGRECPGCTGRKRKTVSDYRGLGTQRGFLWMGKEKPKNAHVSTLWKCGTCDCVWSASYTNVRQGSGCPGCSNHLPLCEKDYRRFEDRGVLWVAKALPKNSGTKTRWQCVECGALWRQTYGNIYSGTGCPSCANIVNGRKSSKAQNKITECLGGTENYYHNGRYIDVALVEEKIAIEYDCWYWHGGKEQEDYKRAMALVSDGWSVLVIKTGKTDVPEKHELVLWLEMLAERRYVEIVREEWGKGEPRWTLS